MRLRSGRLCNKKITTKSRSAVSIVTSNIGTIHADPELKTCLDALYILSKPHHNNKKLYDAIRTMISELPNESILQDQHVRLCTVIPSLVVTNESIIDTSNGVEKFVSGGILCKQNFPIYCDVSIKKDGDRYVIKPANFACPLSTSLAITGIDRLHVKLARFEMGYFYACIDVDTCVGVLKSNGLKIIIGHGSKSDAENNEFCQYLFNEMRNIEADC